MKSSMPRRNKNRKKRKFPLWFQEELTWFKTRSGAGPHRERRRRKKRKRPISEDDYPDFDEEW